MRQLYWTRVTETVCVCERVRLGREGQAIDQLVVYLSIQISFIAPHKSYKMVSFLFAKQLL